MWLFSKQALERQTQVASQSSASSCGMSVCVGGDAGERLCPACEDVGVGGRDSGEEEEQEEEMKIHVGVPDLCGVLEAARKDREVGDGKQGRPRRSPGGGSRRRGQRSALRGESDLKRTCRQKGRKAKGVLAKDLKEKGLRQITAGLTRGRQSDFWISWFTDFCSAPTRQKSPTEVSHGG